MRYQIRSGLISCLLIGAVLAQTYSGESRGQYLHLKKEPDFPPVIQITIEFSEPSGNLFLDAEEVGTIIVRIENLGRGKATGLGWDITPRFARGLSFISIMRDISLPSGGVRTIRIPITASETVTTTAYDLLFTFVESNAFQPDPIRLSFETRATVAPNLILLDGIEIEGGNHNGMIEPMEVVEITCAVQNVGYGTARAVSATLSVPPDANVFFTDPSLSKANLGDMNPGDVAEFTFEMFTNKNASKLPIFLQLRESSGRFGKSGLRLPLEFKRKGQEIREVVVEGIEDVRSGRKDRAEFGVDVDISIPETSMQNPNAVAVVIGNRNYMNSDVPTVDYAHRDAHIIREYLVKTLGYREGNILFQEDATMGRFNSLFGTKDRGGQLENILPRGADVFVYYSGHGAPDPESRGGYFVPVDCDPSMVSMNGYSLDLFYEKMNALDAGHVTIVIDACFSGSSERGMLLKRISPVFIEVDHRVAASSRVSVYTSASGDQVSSWYPDKKHSLFTYFFLKGIQGEGDANTDGKLTSEELERFLKENVSYEARRLNNRVQEPEVTSDPKRVVVRY